MQRLGLSCNGFCVPTTNAWVSGGKIIGIACCVMLCIASLAFGLSDGTELLELHIFEFTKSAIFDVLKYYDEDDCEN